MIKIKFCGLTRPEDVLRAEELAADFIGFNCYRKSSRFVSPKKLSGLCGLVRQAGKVAVFVNSGEMEIRRVADSAAVDYIQLHGDETPEFCRLISRKTGKPVIKAFRLAAGEDLPLLEAYREAAEYFLLDAKTPAFYGGTGRVFPWKLAVAARKFGRPFFLAGGLTPENVAEACRLARPFAVDTAGGCEDAPGIKSREKMRLFAAQVRSLTD